MTNIILCGCSGRMGKAIISAIKNDCTIVAGVDLYGEYKLAELIKKHTPKKSTRKKATPKAESTTEEKPKRKCVRKSVKK